MTTERPTTALGGALGLTICLLFVVATIFSVAGAVRGDQPILLLYVTLPCVVLAFLSGAGLFTVQPNQAVVLILFGTYVGTVRKSGWWWTNRTRRIRKRPACSSGKQEAGSGERGAGAKAGAPVGGTAGISVYSIPRPAPWTLDS